MRVLVVEDEPKMAGLLQRALTEEGYAADLVATGADAIWAATENPYDAIVLDVMLPDLDGFAVCRRLRANDRWAPVLMLTARDGVRDRVDGLDAGADDYLTKPFSFSELFARLRALLRRGAAERPAVLRAGDLELDPATRRVRRGDTRIELTAKEFALLEYLMRRAGEVLTRSQLIEHVWDFGYDGDSNVVDVYVRYLREKIDRPFGCDTIETVRGSGYRLRETPADDVADPAYRLALVCAGLVAALIVALGAVVYLRLEADLTMAVDDELRTRADAVIAEGGVGELSVSATDVGDIFAQRVHRDGRVFASTPGFSASPVLPPADLAALGSPLPIETVVAATDEPILARLLALPAPDGTIVIVGVSFDDQRAALETLLLELALALPVAVLLAGAVGWLVAGAALRPVERIREEADAISGSELDRRLPVPGTKDELSALGTSLNRMLDRLEAAVEHERRFVDDASHELRTPLANLKAELDLALGRSRTEAELVAALRSAAEETDRLTRLAEDLLVLARADGGRLPIRREDVDVGRLVQETADSFAGRALRLGVTIEVSIAEPVTARLDPARVRQALGNLIDNALRHTPRGGRVTVAVERDQASIAVSVVDSGDGFPQPFLAHAFEPFSRADAARSRSDGGTGLGLAIARAVAESHGGTVEARNLPDHGAEVALRVPG